MTKISALQPAAQSQKDLSEPRGNRLITPDELARVDMLTIRYRRSWRIEFVGDCIQRCRKANKLYTLLVVGGNVSDTTDSNYLKRLESLIDDLGAVCSKDPLCWGVHTAVPPTGHSEELFWGRPMPVKAISANKRIMERWCIAFQKQKKLLAGAANDPTAMRILMRHGMELGNFLYKINSLSAKTAVRNWAGTDLIVEAAQMGADIGFEMLCGSNESRFGGTCTKAMANMNALEKRANKRAEYLAVYKADI